jgi:predicted ferric reductase
MGRRENPAGLGKKAKERDAKGVSRENNRSFRAAARERKRETRVKYDLAQTLFWIAAFLLLAMLPTAVALSGHLPPGRGFWVEFGALLGFLGLGILNLQCVMTGRFRWFATGFGLDNMLQFHKQTGLFALILILAHPGILLLADRVFVEYFDPRVNLPRTLALGFVTLAALLLVASSLWRLTFRLSYEQWRLAHGLLSFAILMLGLGHILMVDHYSAPFWRKTAFVAMTGAALYLIIHSRLIRPWAMRRTPYRIAEVRPERNESWTLVVEPVEHPGFTWRSGQFVWLTLGDSPFSLQQHPFSIASSPLQKRVELTIKELGDFTASVKKARPGARAWLEGPYGAFTHNPRSTKGAVFIAGGVGITPIMSHLRTARERGGLVPYLLIYGNKDWESILFREEIEAMTERIRLKVVHVLEDPEGWQGETGFIDPEVLDRHLPEDLDSYEYFICGPEAMIDLTEPVLRARGIRPQAIHSERFDMV